MEDALRKHHVLSPMVVLGPRIPAATIHPVEKEVTSPRALSMAALGAMNLSRAIPKMPATVRVVPDVPGQTKTKFVLTMQRALNVPVAPVASARALTRRPVFFRATELKNPLLANRLRHSAGRQVFRVWMTSTHVVPVPPAIVGRKGKKRANANASRNLGWSRDMYNSLHT